MVKRGDIEKVSVKKYGEVFSTAFTIFSRTQFAPA